jgi:tetratricopeptide (TPR) repeat protein
LVRGFGWAAIYVLLSSSTAWADGYRDFTIGLSASLQDQRDKATKFLSSALAQPDIPANLLPVAYLKRAFEYAGNKQYTLAIADFAAALRAKPDYVEAYLGRCRTYSEMHRLAEAISDCTSAIQMQPDNWRLHGLRLQLYRKARQFEPARADLDTVIAARPENPELLIIRADIFRESNQFDKAIADAQASHSLLRRWSVPFSELGLIYVSERDFKKARDSFDDAVDRSRDPVDYIQRGQAEWAMGAYDDAAKSFGESLEHSQLQSYAFLWLTIADLKAGKKVPDDIVARFGRSDLSQWPGPLVSLYLGKTRAAEVLALKGEDPDSDDDKECASKFFTAEWQEVSGNIAEAKRLLQQISSVCMPDSFTALYAGVDSARLPQ